jgi:hypothetical protein
VAAAIAERDRPGHGMETARVAADQVHRWRRLTTGDLDEVTGVLEAAGVDASPPTDDPAGVRVSSPLRPPVAPREPSSAGSPR